MRYFRLKYDLRWNICQTPKQTNAMKVKKPKFCTRLLVDSETGIKCHQNENTDAKGKVAHHLC